MDRKARTRALLTLIMVTSGVCHFAFPRPFLQIMPPFIPLAWHAALVQLSGACEIAGGIGIHVPRLRSLAGLGLCALLLAVFPANIYMAVSHVPMGDAVWPTWLAWARLPLQFLLIAMAWRSTRPPPPR